MHLFNFDLLRVEPGTDVGSCGESLYFVIDINYFPGVDKIPHFEEKFVQFLQSACRGLISS
jgi:inositol-1,3,4-trisphosphate 5/6-kinase/inositol-tetrakisphosphate 1-kinase